MSKGDTVAGRKPQTFVVVLRAKAHVRFAVGEGFETKLDGLPGSLGSVRVRMRTRWIDEGHAAPTPRELWIETLGQAHSLDEAASNFGSSGRFFASILAFVGNAPVDVPQVHLAYNATENENTRQFLEVFIPDERGLPRGGRIVRTGELVAFFEGVNASAAVSRLVRSLEHYRLALQYWYFGGEWLSLSHLYIAVENLTDAVIERECQTRGMAKEQLAGALNIDTGDRSWRHNLAVWARKSVIFEGDNETYREARYASDGIEHGFLEFNEVNRHALSAAYKTFEFVRRTILSLSAMPRERFAELYERPPRDVESLRKIVRGHFVGDGGDPALPSEEYPFLEWQSSVKSFTREGESFVASFNETFTVRCAPSYEFRGELFEVRGRLENGMPPVSRFETAVRAVPTLNTAATDEIFRLLRRADAFASMTAAPGASEGVQPLLQPLFGIFSVQISLFEAIETLLKDRRPVQAIVLLHSLIMGACRLQVAASYPDPRSASVSIKVESLMRSAHLNRANASLANEYEQAIARLKMHAAEQGVDLPSTTLDVRSAPFFIEKREALDLAAEVAQSDDLAIGLHTVERDGEVQSISTQVSNPRLLADVAGEAVLALVCSTVSFVKALSWSYDADIAADLQELSERIGADNEAGPKA